MHSSLRNLARKRYEKKINFTFFVKWFKTNFNYITWKCNFRINILFVYFFNCFNIFFSLMTLLCLFISPSVSYCWFGEKFSLLFWLIDLSQSCFSWKVSKRTNLLCIEKFEMIPNCLICFFKGVFYSKPDLVSKLASKDLYESMKYKRPYLSEVNFLTVLEVNLNVFQLLVFFFEVTMKKVIHVF